MITLDQLTARVMDAMDGLGYPNALCGGLAHNAWVGPDGQFPTFDVDVAVLVPQSHKLDVSKVAEILAKRTGEQVTHRDTFRSKTAVIAKFQVGEGDDRLFADLVMVDAEYAEQAIASSGSGEIAGRDRKVLQPEDVVIFKALGQRKKDLDRIGRLHELLELDIDYIELWSRRLGRWEFAKRALAYGSSEEDRESED